MPLPPLRPKHLAALGLLGLAALAASPAAAEPYAGKHRDEQRLVLRGSATVVDAGCDASACRLELVGGRFRGTPVGSGTYDGAIRLKVADAFPNGEDGSCAPLGGRIVLGAGTPNRLVLAVAGDSCQDGSGPLPGSSFTGLAEFTVKRGTGRYARASGSGLAVLTEDAARLHRMTLIGRVAS
jgi:hypothetical protein